MFNDTSRYRDDIFTIDNSEFQKYIADIYKTSDHQLNKVNTSDKETSFLDLNIKVIGSDIDTNNTTKAITLDFLSISRRFVCYISQLFRFARATIGLDFNSKSSKSLNYFKTNDTGLHILQTSKNIRNVL